MNEESQRDRDASLDAITDPERVEGRRGRRDGFPRGLKRIFRKRTQQRIESGELLGDFVQRERVAGKMKRLFDGNGGRKVGLA